MTERDGRAPASGAAPLVRPLSAALLDDPLEYLAADHTRQRVLTSALRRFGEARCAPHGEAVAVAAYLARDLGLHHLDEEEDLFPALRKRQLPGDELDPVLDRLHEDHMRATPHLSRIVEALTEPAAADPVALGRTACKAMLTYAEHERRHLAIENAVVLPMARLRLTPKDVATMSRRMKLRRGVPV